MNSGKCSTTSSQTQLTIRLTVAWWALSVDMNGIVNIKLKLPAPTVVNESHQECCLVVEGGGNPPPPS